MIYGKRLGITGDTPVRLVCAVQRLFAGTSPAGAIVVLLVVTVVTLISTSKFQSPVTYNSGQGWDGVEYYRMADEIRSGRPISARAPEVSNAT
jgi:hypothetical protein